MSCYLVGCEIVTSSLLLLCVMETLHFTAHSLNQRLLFGVVAFAWKWSIFHDASREIKDESLWKLFLFVFDALVANCVLKPQMYSNNSLIHMLEKL